MATDDYKPPGRLGDPKMCLATDPRAHPGILASLEAFGLDQYAEFKLPPLSIDTLTPVVKASEDGVAMMYEALPNDLPDDAEEPEVATTTQTIKGVDGNDITLYIFKPTAAAAKGSLPCIIYTHGGGMVILKTANKVHKRWAKSLALQDTIVILPDYRNAYTAAGHNPFPAGLNDCATAAQYVASHKSELGISNIILHGESGGGNLAIATALKAKRDGWISSIAGVYGVVPYISNAYCWPRERQLAELPSLVENDGYFLSVSNMTMMGYYYSPDDKETSLAWPYHATVEELKGLPPVLLSMDELDPLRDEGLALYRKLLAAGVKTSAHVHLGTVHASAMIFRQAAPDVHNALVRSIATFAHSL